MHGGRPGSPDDSPTGPDQVLMIARWHGIVHPMSATVAAVQASPVFLDREATIEKIGRLSKEAAANDAKLVAFPEGFVPTYPDWVWRTTPWADGSWYARWIEQCVDVPGPACDALAAIAREYQLYL